jgi:hypothetical protein
MTLREKIIRASAYHEAGHAVAASLLGDDIVDVRINRDARNTAEIGGGVTRHDPCYAVAQKLGATSVKTSSDEYRKAWEVNLIVALAGPEAQRRYDPKSLRKSQHRTDKRDIDEHLRGVEPQSTRERYRHWGKRNAALIVSKYWPAIEKVAAAPLEHGVLTGEEVKTILAACELPALSH